MTTQYTPILKLALPVEGELDGSWGDVVNDNITSMVEQAVAGRVVINTWSTNSHTLTTANGTTAEARCAMLSLTDSGTQLSAAGTVICPALSKIYIVQNAAGQIITVKTASGSGIAIPNGATSFVFCDGTNVLECLTNIVALTTTGNITVGGTISGNGSGLTTLNGSNISSGTVAAARVATLNQNTTGSAATLTTARTIAGVSFNGSANISLNNNAITNGAGYTTNTGDITGVTAGTGISGGGTSGTVTITNSSPNATHTGEVTGSGALTIANNVVDEANLKVSNAPTNGYALTAQSGNTGGLTWAEISSGGGGDITGVTAGTGISGGGTSGTVTITNSAPNVVQTTVSGNAGTATALATARTIGGTSFDGTSNIAVALADTATKLATARTIAGIAFDGTSNISLNNSAITNGAGYTTNTGDITAVVAGTGLSGGGTSGSVTLTNSSPNVVQTTVTGNAGTATTLQTARTIGGVSFNGSANINLPGVNSAGNQNTTGASGSVATADESSDTTCFITFATAASGNLPMKTGSNLLFNSSSGVVTSTDYTVTSDRRLKKNINDMVIDWDRFNQYRAVLHEWNDPNKTGVFPGMIAQEVQKINPSLIEENTDNGILSLNYAKLVPELIQTIQDLNARLEALENK